VKHYGVFSEAIREGAKFRPQGFGSLLSGGASCAVGAALEAMLGSVPPLNDLHPFFEDVGYPYMVNTVVSCPLGHCFMSNAKSDLACTVLHLNDHHKWTREAIADWLSEEEEKLGFILLTEEVPNEVALATSAEMVFQECKA
jgi:hypothetical protein